MKRTVVFVVVAVLFVPGVLGATFPDDWNRQGEMQTNSSLVQSKESDFPYYVNMNALPSDFHTHTSDGAPNVRITTDNDGSNLVPREVVSYNATSDTGELHFKNQTANTTDKTYYIWYGNSTGASAPANTATYGRNNVWDSYGGVWHIGESSGSAATDSTGNSDATFKGSLPTQTSGIIGDAQDMTPSNNDHAEAGFDSANNLDGDQYLHAWVNHDGLNNKQEFLSRWNNNENQFLLRMAGNGDFEYFFDGGDAAAAAGMSISTGTWYHVVGRLDTTADTAAIFVDGTKKTSNSNSNTPISASSDDVSIGAFNDDQRYMNGQMDEVRIAKNAFTDGWVGTQYDMQSSNTAFWTFQNFGSTNPITLSASTFTPENFNETSIVNNTLTYNNSQNLSANIRGEWSIDGTNFENDTFNSTPADSTVTASINLSQYPVNDSDTLLVRWNATDTSGNTSVTTHSNKVNNTGDLIVTAEEKITQASIDRFNATVEDTSIETTNGTAVFENINTRTYNVTVQSGAYLNNLTKEATVKFGAVRNTTLTRFYDSNLTINATDQADDTPLSDFNGWVYNDANNFNETYNTTGTNTTVSLVQNLTYTVYWTKTNYTDNRTTKDINATNEFITFNQYKFRTLDITFKDQADRTIIDDRTVFFDLISDEFAQNYTTSNGTLLLELLTPANYLSRYSASEYTERFYQFNVDNNTGDNLTLYLINESDATNVTVSVIDENADPIEGAFVKPLKYYISDNEYLVQEIAQTNADGDTFLDLTLSDEYYKFIVQKNGEVLRITEPNYIESDTITLQVFTGGVLGTNYDRHGDISHSLSYNDTSKNFIFTYSNIDNTITDVCLKLYKISPQEKTQEDSSCSTDPSQTLYAKSPDKNNTKYVAEAYYYPSNDDREILLTSLSHSNLTTLDIGNIGLLLQALFTITFTIIFLTGAVELAPIIAPVTLVMGRTMNLNTISYDYLFPLVVVGFVISFMIYNARR